MERKTTSAAARAARRPAEAALPLMNICSICNTWDLARAQTSGSEALHLVEQVVNRFRMDAVMANLALGSWLTGEWTGLVELVDRLSGDFPAELAIGRTLVWLVDRATGRTARATDGGPTVSEASDDAMRAWLLIAAKCGREQPRTDVLAEAVALYRRAMRLEDDFGFLWPLAVDPALDLGDVAVAAELLAPIGGARAESLSPLVRGQLLRLRGEVARVHPVGDRTAAEADLRAAVEALDDFGAVVYAARARLSLASLLLEDSRSHEAEELLGPAGDTFGRLGATPWLEQVTSLQRRRPAPTVSAG